MGPGAVRDRPGAGAGAACVRRACAPGRRRAVHGRRHPRADLHRGPDRLRLRSARARAALRRGFGRAGRPAEDGLARRGRRDRRRAARSARRASARPLARGRGELAGRRGRDAVVVPLALDDRCLGFLLADGPGEDARRRRGDARAPRRARGRRRGARRHGRPRRRAIGRARRSSSTPTTCEARLRRDRVPRAAHADRGRARNRRHAPPARRRPVPTARSSPSCAARSTSRRRGSRSSTQSLLDLSRDRVGRAAGAAAAASAARRASIALLQQIAPDRADVRVEIPESWRSSPTPRHSTASSATSSRMPCATASRRSRSTRSPGSRSGSPFATTGLAWTRPSSDRLFDRFCARAAGRGAAPASGWRSRARTRTRSAETSATQRADPGARFELVLPV